MNIQRILAQWHRAEKRIAKRQRYFDMFPGATIVDHRLDELVKRTVQRRFQARTKTRRLRNEVRKVHYLFGPRKTLP